MALALHLTAEEGSRLWHGVAGHGCVFSRGERGETRTLLGRRCRGPDFVSERNRDISARARLGRSGGIIVSKVVSRPTIGIGCAFCDGGFHLLNRDWLVSLTAKQPFQFPHRAGGGNDGELSFFTSTNSMRSSASSPSAFRTCTGMVTCPLEVMVAAASSAILIYIYICIYARYSLHYRKEQGGNQSSCTKFKTTREPTSIFLRHTPAPPDGSRDTVRTLSSRFPAQAQSGLNCRGKYGASSSSRGAGRIPGHA